MTGRECYERFVAAMGGGPPFGELTARERAAWDAVANPSAPRQRGRVSRPAVTVALHASPRIPPRIDDESQRSGDGGDGDVR